MFQKGKRTYDPSSPGGTNYFNHYPSNYLKPYGLASPAPDHITLLKRANPISCERLKRPKIAMSEFAATMVENIKWLSTEKSKWENRSEMRGLQSAMEPLLGALLHLNTKNQEADLKPHHIDEVLESMYQDESETHEAMIQLFQVGGSMYLMATQYLVVKELLSSPAEYADKMVGNELPIKDFKRKRNVPGVLDMLKTTCAPPHHRRSTERTSSKSLMAELKAAQTHGKSRATQKQKRIQRKAEDSETVSSDGDTPTPKRHKKHNKKSKVTLPKRSRDTSSETDSTAGKDQADDTWTDDTSTDDTSTESTSDDTLTDHTSTKARVKEHHRKRETHTTTNKPTTETNTKPKTKGKQSHKKKIETDVQPTLVQLEIQKGVHPKKKKKEDRRQPCKYNTLYHQRKQRRQRPTRKLKTTSLHLKKTKKRKR